MYVPGRHVEVNKKASKPIGVALTSGRPSKPRIARTEAQKVPHFIYERRFFRAPSSRKESGKETNRVCLPVPASSEQAPIEKLLLQC